MSIIFRLVYAENIWFRIKRRSAFAAHLKRHHIDTVSLDIDIFAPPLLPAAIPEPRRRSFSEIISCDVKPATSKETEMPFKFSDADRDYIYSRRSVHGHPSDTALYGNPYSKFAETYHTLYPSTVPPSVATTFSHLALSSNPFEYSSEEATRWEDLVDKLYVLDSSSPQAPEAPQTDINMYNTPPSSPAGESSASESSSTGELHTVNISQGALTFDHFAFPPPTPSRGFFGQTSKHCHIPQKNLADLPFLTGLSPEATYTFA
ncbi:hypothetical protein GALMADRAFT_688835 [Galerina marginata CBS 339.88]|uniref:Uncharacterized protein n=1 Tax=Galerina marginata (strain CBS 339.88) TaxID=685588 RepID=A0A067TNV8_GALM3|nr:hypothetical protein GALMADRAFT_688835 [Galerina marginata CBS 339.88]